MSSRLTALVRWSARVFGGDVAERVFAPLVADWQHEADAHASASATAVVHARWGGAFALSAIRVGATQLVRWRTSRAGAHTVGRTLASSVAASVVVILAPVVWSLRGSRELTPVVLALLLAKACAIALPLALGTVAVWTEGPRATRGSMLLALTAVAVVMQVGSVGWIQPALARASDRERVCTLSAPPTPATLALHTLIRPALAGEPLTLSGDARRQEVANRIAWTVWPAAVAAFAWRLGPRTRRRRTAGVGLAWCVPAVLLVAPELARWWLVEGGPYGRPSLLVTFMPTLSLLMVAWWLGPADAEARVSTLEHSTEAR